ncbi:similar to hypothetical protein FLJ90652, isoform CRA_g [Rattus norvegicus]|uniref:Uncharacterized protein LOC293494 n=1 Tax=Rattus norvegicus TaxID=10116 RepID=A6I9H2_RAT|nr:similar to hypothetical protein FLJ90652, isoform CRA_g [Rattus norvegicus]
MVLKPSCCLLLPSLCFVFFSTPQDRVSLCSPGLPGTCFVDQASLRLALDIPCPSILKHLLIHCVPGIVLVTG